MLSKVSCVQSTGWRDGIKCNQMHIAIHRVGMLAAKPMGFRWFFNTLETNLKASPLSAFHGTNSSAHPTFIPPQPQGVRLVRSWLLFDGAFGLHGTTDESTFNRSADPPWWWNPVATWGGQGALLICQSVCSRGGFWNGIFFWLHDVAKQSRTGGYLPFMFRGTRKKVIFLLNTVFWDPMWRATVTCAYSMCIPADSRWWL